MIKAKKSLGQNFLTDHQVASRIVDTVSPSRTDSIVEIGPGTGALTHMLASRSSHVTAVEIDPRLADQLRATSKEKNLTILTADALSLDWIELIGAVASRSSAAAESSGPSGRVRVVGNLPYYISTPIIEKLLSLSSRIFDMTLMLQREVADRIASEPGGRDYGYLSVLVQYYCVATKLFDVPPSAFTPEPKVQSAVIRLRVREEPAVKIADESKFFAVVRACFAQRRKTILNNLKAAAAAQQFVASPESALEAASVLPQRRAETLSLDEFERLFKSLFVA